MGRRRRRANLEQIAAGYSDYLISIMRKAEARAKFKRDRSRAADRTTKRRARYHARKEREGEER